MSLNYKGILHIQGLDGQVCKSQAQAKTAKKSLRKELKKSEKKKKRLDAEDCQCDHVTLQWYACTIQ